MACGEGALTDYRGGSAPELHRLPSRLPGCLSGLSISATAETPAENLTRREVELNGWFLSNRQNGSNTSMMSDERAEDPADRVHREKMKTDWPQVIVASLIAVSMLVAAVEFTALEVTHGALLVAALALAASTAALRFKLRAGGITGDFLGATEQIGECVVLLVLAPCLSR